MATLAHTVGVFIDHAADRQLMVDFLRARGHRVLAPSADLEAFLSGGAPSGDGAPPVPDAAAWRDASLLIADHRAAFRYGPSLLNLRYALNRSHIPSLALLPTEADPATWLRAGFDDVLRLPVRQVELEARLNVLLRLREEAEHQFRSFFEGALAGFYRMAPEGRFLMANAALARLLGYATTDELLRAPGPAGPNRGADFMAALEASDAVSARETTWRRRDGEALTVLESATARRTPSGKLLFVEGTIEDITERKRQEEMLRRSKEEAERARAQAQEAVRAKSTFLTNMSHEIRTPLTAILGFASLLARKVPEAQRSYAQRIETAGHRLLDTLNLILEMSRLDADRVQLDLQPLRMAEEVKTAAELFRSAAHEKGLSLRVRVAPEARNAYAPLDVGALASVLNNLIGNAVKFTEHGEIEVGVEADASRVQVRVRDTGIGIDAAFLKRLFAPFEQESRGLQRTHEGSGLGLAITKRLVDLLGGEVSVESEKGAGSTFTVAFDRVVPGQAAAAVRRRLLIVEDDDDMRLLIKDLLEDAFAVTTAATAEQALAATQDAHFDLIILDLGGTGGERVARALRQQPDHRGAPILALTTYPLPEHRGRFLETGPSRYLAKPFKVEDLLDRVAELAPPG